MSAPPTRGLPSSERELAAAPATAELMARIRAADPCASHDRVFAQRFGRVVDGNLFTGLAGCAIVAESVDEPGIAYVFDFELAHRYLVEDRADDTAEEVAGKQVFQSSTYRDLGDGYTCAYYLPVGLTGLAHMVRGKRTRSAGQSAHWPQRCEATRDYLAAVADSLLALPPITNPSSPDRKTLTHKSPCAATAQIEAQFPGWTVESTAWAGVYSCSLTLSKTGNRYRITVAVGYRRDNEQAAIGPAARVISREGLNGVEFGGDSDARCAEVVAYRPADPARANNAHLINVDVSAAPRDSPVATAADLPVDLCESAAATIGVVIRAAR
ncbi:hypothetical protein [Nocardia sp. NPDC058666]|uniref:hypothetical protein n=1 Tax=Nocardia sp. NPDC058666 TaxID=3346587 RepID=UPI00365E6912